jgi:N-formylglutamate deformylase
MPTSPLPGLLGDPGPESFTVNKGTVRNSLLVQIPHTATFVPPDVRPSILLNDAALERELLALTDRYTDELFGHVSETGGTAVIYMVSRLVVDPERFADDDRETMAAVGMGAIYTKTTTGATLRENPTEGDRDALLSRFYWPYHRAIEREVDSLLQTFGRCLILDAHSFPSHPLPFELDQRLGRPDICIGTDDYHTPEPLAQLIETYCADRGLQSARNHPYCGTLVPMKYWRFDDRVCSVMIEINRRLYMHEDTGRKTDSFSAVQKLLGEVADSVATWVQAEGQ